LVGLDIYKTACIEKELRQIHHLVVSFYLITYLLQLTYRTRQFATSKLMMLLLPTLFTSLLATHQSINSYRYTSTTIHAKRNDKGWQQTSPSDTTLAKKLHIEPLDDANIKLLNEVHPRNYINPKPLDVYDLVVIGAGAGGLVSSRQVC